MDTKITLSFDEAVILKAKKFAEANNISLSRLTEFLLSKVISSNYKTIDSLPVADWVSILSEGPVEYQTKAKTRKMLKEEYYKLFPYDAYADEDQMCRFCWEQAPRLSRRAWRDPWHVARTSPGRGRWAAR